MDFIALIDGDPVQEVLNLIADYRFLAAHNLYQQIQHQLSLSGITIERKQLIEAQLATHAEIIASLCAKAEEINSVVNRVHEDADWKFGLEMFGITTHYQHDEEDGSIKIKLTGTLDDLPLFEQCAVIHEVDLFSEWIPFCRESITVDKIGKAELVPYLCFGIPGLTRDMAMLAYGADCLFENSKILILGRSIDEHPTGEKELPFKAIGWLHNRMVVKEFSAILEVLTPTSAKTCIIAQVDPRTPLPKSMLNFLIKNLAGALLYFFQQQVVKVSQDPDCKHAQRIRSNRDFYSGWVLPKLRNFCEHKGWEQPVVTSLGDKGGIMPRTKEDDNDVDIIPSVL